MGGRVGLMFLLVLAANLACDARDLVATDFLTTESEASHVSVLQVNQPELQRGLKLSDGVVRNEVCMLCEEFAAQALNYLSENKTQTEILNILYKSCSKLRSLKQQCVTLVDYYAPIFFLEIAYVQPGDFCQKVNLCEAVVSYSKNTCVFCQQAVSEALLKLKDPDTQLEIIELLLKGCDAVEKYLKKCKTMVFEYAPLILSNAEELLETTDVCTMVHACDSYAAITLEGVAFTMERPSLLSKY